MAGEGLTGNAANVEDVRRAGRKEKSREALLLASLRKVMESREGRHVLGSLLEDASLYEGGFQGSGSALYFREGRRDYGLQLLARIIRASEDGYELLERERRARARSEATENQGVQTRAVTGDSE